MLTSEQFEAIGRLTIAFNHIEELIDIYAALLMGTSEDEVAQRIVSRQQFLARKKALLLDLLKVIRRNYPALDDKITKVELALARVDPVTNKRNHIVHALVILDHKEQRPKLWNKQKEAAVDCDVDSLKVLTEEIDAVGSDVLIACYELANDLLDKR